MVPAAERKGPRRFLLSRRLPAIPWRGFFSRLGQVALVLVSVALITFALQRALPGDAAEIWVGPMPGATTEMRERAVEQARERLGLDRSYPEQFALWGAAVLRGDLGLTTDGQPVSRVVRQRTGASLQLIFWTSLFSIVVSVLLSVYAMRSRFRWMPRVGDALSTLFIAMPGFWIAFLLVLAFAVEWGVLPASGYVPFRQDPVAHFMRMALPMLTLSTYLISVYYRYLYAGMQDASTSPYTTTARAKGLSNRAVMYLHILPNSLLPFVTTVGMFFGVLIGGTVIIEQIFAWPGLGSLIVLAANRQDVNLLAALVLVVAFVFVVSALLVDALYKVIDPRMRRG